VRSSTTTCKTRRISTAPSNGLSLDIYPPLKSLDIASDTACMPAYQSFDMFARRLVAERRDTSDRRTEWRGGRRDADWLYRPPDALKRLEVLQRRAARIRMFVASPLVVDSAD
jgi:hypothetical protein